MFLAFDSAKAYFNDAKVRVVGTPVREEFFQLEPKKQSSDKTNGIDFWGKSGSESD